MVTYVKVSNKNDIMANNYMQVGQITQINRQNFDSIIFFQF